MTLKKNMLPLILGASVLGNILLVDQLHRKDQAHDSELRRTADGVRQEALAWSGVTRSFDRFELTTGKTKVGAAVFYARQLIDFAKEYPKSTDLSTELQLAESGLHTRPSVAAAFLRQNEQYLDASLMAPELDKLIAKFQGMSAD